MSAYNLFLLSFLYIADLSLGAAQTIMLCYLDKVCIQDIKLEKELKPLAKKLGLSGLRNKDKNQFIKSISVSLLERGFVSVNKQLKNVSSREDVTIIKKSLNIS